MKGQGFVLVFQKRSMKEEEGD